MNVIYFLEIMLAFCKVSGVIIAVWKLLIFVFVSDTLLLLKTSIFDKTLTVTNSCADRKSFSSFPRECSVKMWHD